MDDVLADSFPASDPPYVADGKTVDGLPGPEDVIDWLRYVQHQCPECEGESR